LKLSQLSFCELPFWTLYARGTIVDLWLWIFWDCWKPVIRRACRTCKVFNTLWKKIKLKLCVYFDFIWIFNSYLLVEMFFCFECHRIVWRRVWILQKGEYFTQHFFRLYNLIFGNLSFCTWLARFSEGWQDWMLTGDKDKHCLELKHFQWAIFKTNKFFELHTEIPLVGFSIQILWEKVLFLMANTPLYHFLWEKMES